MAHIVGFIIAAMIWAVADCARAQQTGDAQRGLALAREACAECHAVIKASGRSPNVNAPTFEAVAKIPGMTSMALSTALQTSHRTMPNIVIKGDDRVDVIAYILSLKDSD